MRLGEVDEEGSRMNVGNGRPAPRKEDSLREDLWSERTVRLALRPAYSRWAQTYALWRVLGASSAVTVERPERGVWGKEEGISLVGKTKDMREDPHR